MRTVTDTKRKHSVKNYQGCTFANNFSPKKLFTIHKKAPQGTNDPPFLTLPTPKPLLASRACQRPRTPQATLRSTTPGLPPRSSPSSCSAFSSVLCTTMRRAIMVVELTAQATVANTKLLLLRTEAAVRFLLFLLFLFFPVPPFASRNSRQLVIRHVTFVDICFCFEAEVCFAYCL